VDRVGHGELRAFGEAISVDGNKLGKLEGVAEDGNLHERAFEKDRGATWEIRKQRRRVKVGNVVGHEDTGAAGRNAVESFNLDADAGNAESDADDEATGFVEWANVPREKREWDENQRRRNGQQDDGDENNEGPDHA